VKHFVLETLHGQKPVHEEEQNHVAEKLRQEKADRRQKARARNFCPLMREMTSQNIPAGGWKFRASVRSESKWFDIFFFFLSRDTP
jgi:hypothetical protein